MFATLATTLGPFSFDLSILFSFFQFQFHGWFALTLRLSFDFHHIFLPVSFSFLKRDTSTNQNLSLFYIFFIEVCFSIILFPFRTEDAQCYNLSGLQQTFVSEQRRSPTAALFYIAFKTEQTKKWNINSVF